MATCSEIKSINTIFFDLDNTLIQTRKADKLACNKMKELLIQEHMVPTDAAAIACATFLQNFRLCPENPDFSIDQWRIRLWAEALGYYSTIASEVYKKWLKLRYHYLALTPNIHTMFVKLREHYMLGLITNGPSNAQWEKVHRLNLKPYFDIILVSGDLAWDKPDPKIFQEAYNYLGVQPHQCIMIGDKLETDILGGIESKLGATVWIPLQPTNLKTKDPHPTFTLENVTDILRLLPIDMKSPIFRRKSVNGLIDGSFKLRLRKRASSVPDLDDCNSNSSDGS